MQTRIMWILIIVLFSAVAFLGWKVMILSNSDKRVETATSTTHGTAKQAPEAPLSARMTVSEPKAHATVDKSFTVSGTAPGPWFSEATFPIKVLDADGNVIARANANALGDWKTSKVTAFTATAHSEGYVGPATIVLMRDNPSGLPENDDAIEVPITIR